MCRLKPNTRYFEFVKRAGSKEANEEGTENGVGIPLRVCPFLSPLLDHLLVLTKLGPLLEPSSPRGSDWLRESSSTAHPPSRLLGPFLDPFLSRVNISQSEPQDDDGIKEAIESREITNFQLLIAIVHLRCTSDVVKYGSLEMGFKARAGSLIRVFGRGIYMCHRFPKIHLWFHNYWPFDGKSSSWSLLLQTYFSRGGCQA